MLALLINAMMSLFQEKLLFMSQKLQSSTESITGFIFKDLGPYRYPYNKMVMNVKHFNSDCFVVLQNILAAVQF